MSEVTYRKVKLAGEEYVLKLGFNAISKIEEYYNKGIFNVVSEETLGFNSTRVFLWAGMLWQNPRLKPDHVGDMIEKDMEENDEFDLGELMELSTQILTESRAFKILAKQSEKEDKESKNEKTA